MVASFDFWENENCYGCKKYENESTKIEDAKCELSFSLCYAYVSDGKIDKKIAERIGYSEWREQKPPAPEVNFVDLNRYCKERESK